MHSTYPSLLVLSGLLAAAGCNDVVNLVLDSGPELPVKNEAGLTALGQQFGQAVQKGDYAAAYALTSAQLKARQTEEQFVAEMKNEWQLHAEGARPEKFEVSTWMPYEDEFKEWDEMPKDVKYAQLEGIVNVKFGLLVEDNEIVTGVSTNLVIVQENGQPKVAHVFDLLSSD